MQRTAWSAATSSGYSDQHEIIDRNNDQSPPIIGGGHFQTGPVHLNSATPAPLYIVRREPACWQETATICGCIKPESHPPIRR